MEQLFEITNSFSVQPSLLDQEEWEHEVSLLKRFVRITDENKGLFFAFLGHEVDIDSYLTSPVYYALTGRKGLWLYQDGNSYVPLCWHPNVDGQILVFPPRGERHADILQKVLTEIPIPPAGVRIARIKLEDIGAEYIQKVEGTRGRSISLSLIKEEPILDWKYPAHILSTKRVSKSEGRAFVKVRNAIRQMDQHKINTRPLCSATDEQILEFVNRWAKGRTDRPEELKELVSPYVETINMLRSPSYNIDGHLFFVNGQLEAVTMWELPNTPARIANAWVSLCSSEHRGLSEFVVKTTAEELQKRNIPYINYGGSETEGLDRFKRKFDPILSLELRSLNAKLEGADTVLTSLLQIQKSRMAA